MPFPWDDSRRAFADAAGWFVRTTAIVGDRWAEPGLGEWDVRALVGHTSRSLLTVEAYLARPADTAEIPSAADYFGATRAMAADPAVAARRRGGRGDRRARRPARGRPGRRNTPDHDRGGHATRGLPADTHLRARRAHLGPRTSAGRAAGRAGDRRRAGPA